MVKVSSIRTKNKMVHSDSGSSPGRTRRSLWLTIIGCTFAVGCTTVKKATVVALGAAVGATAGIALSGGAIAPIVGATTIAFVTDVVTEISYRTAVNSMDCAPDTIWTVIEKAVELGGIGLILAFIVVPVIAGWLIPGPTKLNRK